MRGLRTGLRMYVLTTEVEEVRNATRPPLSSRAESRDPGVL
jgi:hypothetical protein